MHLKKHFVTRCHLFAQPRYMSRFLGLRTAYNLHFYSTVSTLDGSSQKMGPQEVAQLLRRVTETSSAKKKDTNSFSFPVDSSAVKHFVDLSPFADGTSCLNAETRLKLLHESLQQLPSMSLGAAVHLLSLIAVSTPVSSSFEASQVCELIAKEEAFWNEAVYELSRLYFSSASNHSQDVCQYDPHCLVELLCVLTSVDFRFTDAHRIILEAAMSCVSGLLDFPVVSGGSKLSSRTIRDKCINNVVYASRGISCLLRLQHLSSICVPFFRQAQQKFMEDTRPIAVFLNHFRDSGLSQNVSVNDVIEVFHALCGIGLFSPEYLTTTLLLQRRYGYEVDAKSQVQLLRAAAGFLTQTPLPFRNLEPEWIFRGRSLQLRETEVKNLQKSLFLSSSEPLSNNGSPVDESTGAPQKLSLPRASYDNRDRSFGLVDTSQHQTQRGGWYDQSFFDDFDKMLNQQTTHILSPVSGDQPGVSEKVDAIDSERFSIVTSSWVSRDSTLDLPRRAAEAEAIFLIKFLCNKLADFHLPHLKILDAVAVLETLAAVGYSPGRLIDSLVQKILIPRISLVPPSGMLSLLHSFARLDIRSIMFLKEATSHIVGTASKYTPMELVLVSEALRSLQCGHTELLYRIMERKDDILQPHTSKLVLQRLQTTFQAVDVSFPELDSFLATTENRGL